MVLMYSTTGTAGSLFISYGLREFLRATGGGYYCCSHYIHQGQGILFALVGWAILFGTVVSLYHRLTST